MSTDKDDSEQKKQQLIEAATELYMAGIWHCDELSSVEEARLWENLRDAIGLDKGTATANGMGVGQGESRPH